MLTSDKLDRAPVQPASAETLVSLTRLLLLLLLLSIGRTLLLAALLLLSRALLLHLHLLACCPSFAGSV